MGTNTDEESGKGRIGGVINTGRSGGSVNRGDSCWREVSLELYGRRELWLCTSYSSSVLGADESRAASSWPFETRLKSDEQQINDIVTVEPTLAVE